MRLHFLVLLFLTCLSTGARADDCATGPSYEEARAVVRDLQRIVAPNGIDESYATPIGGIPQWINVRGQDRANPIILFVHGGPAAPLTPSTWEFQRPLEEYFTVVHWDQRGAGKTYLETKPDDISSSIRIDRYVSDAIEVAEHLRQKHGQTKLILMGHSWGTIIGMKAALQRPDLFYAYVGIGQVINSRDNERLSFEYALDQARQHQNTQAIDELAAIAPYPGTAPVTRERIVTARKWAQFYGGLSAYRDGGAKYYFGAPLLSPEYDCKAVNAIDQGNVFTLGRILPEFLAVDLKAIHQFPIPVLMFMGRHDYTTPSAPTAAWLDQVKAPYKKAVWFERSAHMIPWEEPGKMLVTLLEYVRPLAVQTNQSGSAMTRPARTR